MAYPLFSDEYFMNEALKEAQNAFEQDEVPVGAVVVSNNRVIARGHNMTEQLGDVTAHAEMIALTSAANFLGAKYLNDCALFVTLEPCLMCASAYKWAQLGRLVFGASDDKAGYHIVEAPVLHPKTEIKFGVLEKECGDLLKAFFRGKRM
ncbi:MAG: nucleoside deaminase [Bacteroidales bacterium]|nr:nucleoside deaminase [Bacteroidales bacterium]MDT8432011.1 nucleoside deaminase [Bacteroidales bacterium]